MDIFVTVSTERREGPKLPINCPECEAKAVTAKSWEEFNKIALFGLIPLKNTQNVFLRCPSCRKKLFTYIELDDLEDYDADGIEEYLAMYKPRLDTVVAVVGLAFFWLPFFGLIWSTIALFANRHRDDWVRIVSIIGFVLSTIVTALMLIKIVKTA